MEPAGVPDARAGYDVARRRDVAGADFLEEITTEDTEITEKMGDETTRITGQILDSAIAVHKELAPGLLESAYEACLSHELLDRGFLVERQKGLPLNYRGLQIDCGYRLDLMVENPVIVEIKAVASLEKIHEAQVLSYMKLSGRRAGLLINFHVRYLKDGIRRFVI